MSKSRLVLASALLLAIIAPAAAETAAENVRPPCCAGSWYPADAETLGKLIDGLMEEASAPSINGKPIALIAPHAGYRFSAPVAASAYKTLRGHPYKRVIVMAFSHRYAGSYRGVDVPERLTAYRTPLGDVPIDREACDRLLKSEMYSSHDRVGEEEHSLELQLPFLQIAVADVKLVPLLVGKMAVHDYAKAAEALLPLIDDETLLVASSDFTHYGTNYGYLPFRSDVAEKIRELADLALAPLEKADFDGFAGHLEETNDTICGSGPILLLLRVLSMRGGAAGARAAVDTSGRMLDDWTNSVTYQSIVFVPRLPELHPEERLTLLRLARRTIAAHLNGQDRIRIGENEFTERLHREGACFVTLKNRGQLRGCIGNLVADGPLWKAVVHNSVMASRDFRFQNDPVTIKELDEIELEISYLTPLRRLESPVEIVVGRDGIVIQWRRQSGVLLPQVGYEPGWTREEFLEALCMKAGVPRGTWKRNDAILYSFQAEVFSENELQP